MGFYCIYGYADGDYGWTEDYSNFEDAKVALFEIMAEYGDENSITPAEGGENSIVHYKTKNGYNYGIAYYD